MNTLKDMNITELEDLKTHWQNLYLIHKANNFRENFIEVENEIQSRQQIKEIEVFHEPGYKWSVWFAGNSIESGLNKKDAMNLAKLIKAENANTVINEQKLTRKEKANNISYLHTNSYNYNK